MFCFSTSHLNLNETNKTSVEPAVAIGFDFGRSAATSNIVGPCGTKSARAAQLVSTSAIVKLFNAIRHNNRKVHLCLLKLCFEQHSASFKKRGKNNRLILDSVFMKRTMLTD